MGLYGISSVIRKKTNAISPKIKYAPSSPFKIASSPLTCLINVAIELNNIYDNNVLELELLNPGKLNGRFWPKAAVHYIFEVFTGTHLAWMFLSLNYLFPFSYYLDFH